MIDQIVKILGVTGFIVVMGLACIIPLIVVYFIKHRLPFFPGRKVFNFYIYRLKEQMPQELPDGWTEHDWIEEHGYIYKKLRAWEYQDNGIPYFWVETKMLNGFQIDFKIFASALPNTNPPAIRLLEKVPESWHGENFVPIDLPPEINLAKYKHDVSSTATRLIMMSRRIRARANTKNLFVDLILPIAAMIIVALIIIVGLNHNQEIYNGTLSMQNTGMMYDYHIKTGTPLPVPEKNTTAQDKGKDAISQVGRVIGS